MCHFKLLAFYQKNERISYVVYGLRMTACQLKHVAVNLMFMDLCIIVQFVQKNPTRCNSPSKFIIPYLYEAHHALGDTPPIIRSLKLQNVQQPSMYAKPEAVSAILGS
jgi:hypothetical protein